MKRYTWKLTFRCKMASGNWRDIFIYNFSSGEAAAQKQRRIAKYSKSANRELRRVIIERVTVKQCAR